MNNSDVQDLCMRLIRADSEQDVIDLLKTAGYWDDPIHWRPYGDTPNNFGTINAQTVWPDGAIVEKIVNSIDSLLIGKCIEAGIDPKGKEKAPASIREAVAMFFDDVKKSDAPTAGRISEWTKTRRTDVARDIALVATGQSLKSGGNPCYTIVDRGEGQTPNMLPETILSLSKDNKVGIAFTQGRFNMGGSACLRFCGDRVLQLVVSRRNPNATITDDDSSPYWGFSIVRRDRPRDDMRNSQYTYLAPVGAVTTPRRGQVLRFSAEDLPLFPDGIKPYAVLSRFGTLIKLYEYQTTGYSNSDILRTDGLRERLDLLLPGIPLPIRLYECRHPYIDKGHQGSHETTRLCHNLRTEWRCRRSFSSVTFLSVQIVVGPANMFMILQTLALYLKKDTNPPLNWPTLRSEQGRRSG